MRLVRLLRAFLAAMALALPGAALADERILHFLSDVTVERDGTLAVAETIRLRSEGNEIQRGIQRDFPTRYPRSAGRQSTVGFDVVEVRRDGRPEPWTTMQLGNGIRIRIGQADVMLPPGEHVYLIRYRTTRQLGHFEDSDELYWNATGTGWTFPIDLAEARIRLPEPAPFGKRDVYTGPAGAAGKYAEVADERPGDILFRTTAPLGVEEGLTVAVAWPKGVVTAPGPQTRAGWWLQDNGPLALAFLGLFGILAYYFHAWRRAGRGPRAGTVVPVFAPPDGMSAASVRYVTKMGTDDRTFAAALIELGVRGRLRLVEGEKGFLKKAKTTIEKTDGAEPVPAPEAAMLAALFAGGDAVLMDDKNHATFTSAKNALQKGLESQYEGSLFVRNWSWSLRGLLLTLLAIWLTATALIVAAPVVSPARLALPILGLVAMVVAFGLYRWSRGAGSALAMLGKMSAIMICILGAGTGLATFGTAMESGRVLPLFVPLLALPVVVSAFWWMAAPTRKGRDVMDRIAGFRHYLSITEEDRLAALHPPEKTPELFERFLPYAIALKVENDWASRFTNVLAAAATAGNARTMGWYSGHSDPWSDPDGFADRMGSSLAGTISSASTAPGSSSGSSGGGSSGGGGGGGGGSGW